MCRIAMKRNTFSNCLHTLFLILYSMFFLQNNLLTDMEISTKPSEVQPQKKKGEFLVKIPKVTKKRYSILKFNESLNIKPQQWPADSLLLEREDNRRQGLSLTGEITQEYGEGSEYGKAAREEARRKKFGRQSRKYEHDKQPWKLAIEHTIIPGPEQQGASNAEEGKKTRKFRSIREVGAGEHADYWVFCRAGNDLEAFKVDEWYQFLPAVTWKYLDADQAEERFKERDKVFNQFALKAQIQKQLNEQEQKQQQDIVKKASSLLKIKDEASSDEEDEGEEGGERVGKSAKGEEKNGNNKKKQKPAQAAQAKKKKQRVENSDEIAAYESDDGDDEGREYDYMSDSGSDTDREELDVGKKVDEDLVGVADEQGLKGALESEEEQEDESDVEMDDKEQQDKEEKELLEEEEEEKKFAEKEVRPKAVKNVEKIMAQKGGGKFAMEPDDNESSDTDSEDDPDTGKMKSCLFMQDKRKKNGQPPPAGAGTSQQRKRPADEGLGESTSADASAKQAAEDPKRAKLMQEEPEVISESFIRKLLEKRPHSTRQLLTKASQRLQQQHGGEPSPGKDKKIVVQLADILKKVQPYQFRKKNEAGKETLFFSMNRTA